MARSRGVVGAAAVCIAAIVRHLLGRWSAGVLVRKEIADEAIGVTLVVGIALLTLGQQEGGDIAKATHATESHCPEDPNADGFVDIFDLGQFAAAFGQSPAPAHLDILPGRLLEESGDGEVSVIGELATVASHFATECHLGTGADSFMMETPSGRDGPVVLSVTNCFSTVATWQARAAQGYPWILHDARSSTRCNVGGFGSNFTGFCNYTFHWWDGANWHLYGAANTGEFVWTYLGNFVCGKIGADEDVHSANLFLPCGREWMVKAYYTIYNHGQLAADRWHWVGTYYSQRIYPCY